MVTEKFFAVNDSTGQIQVHSSNASTIILSSSSTGLNNSEYLGIKSSS